MRDINSLIGMQLGRLIIIGEGEPRLQKNGYKRRTIRCQCTCVDHTIVDIIESDLFRRENGNKNQLVLVGVCGESRYKCCLNYLNILRTSGLKN